MIENFTKAIERLEYYIDCKGISFNQLAKAIDVSNSYFSKMVKSKGSLGEDILKKILLFYEEVNPEWLILGNGEMLRENDRQQYNTPTKQSIVAEPQAKYTKQDKSAELLRILSDLQEDNSKLINSNTQLIATNSLLVEINTRLSQEVSHLREGGKDAPRTAGAV